mgnify:CR=1 FL=1
MNYFWRTAAVLTLGALLGCNDKPTATDSPTATTQTPLRVATESSFKPFSYLDNEGNLAGFEIDLANALCAQMQTTCEISSQDWDALIPALNSGKFDAVMAGMSATPARQEVVDFSEPYFNNTLVLVGKKDANADISQIDGKTVATQQATVSAKYLADNYPKVLVKEYGKQDEAYLDLTAGRVDYMLSDIVPISDWLNSEAGANFAIQGAPINIDDQIAIAVKKGDNATVTKLNTALAALKQNGEYDALVAKYFTPTQNK